MAKILLVEDEAFLRKIVRDILIQESHQVMTANNGQEALEIQPSSQFDLVITDLIMPEKEGIEMIVELKRMAPALKIIAMSGGGRNNPTDYLALAKGLGASQTLAKPFTREELLGVVNYTLS